MPTIQISTLTIKSHPKQIFRLLLLGVLLTVACVSSAAEKIISFHSAIELTKEGRVNVTETIQVQVENNQIRRGIFRDFPTIYKTRFLTKSTVDFKLEQVLRNDKPEPFHLEMLSEGVRIYIGAEDGLVPRGVQTYTLAYSTNRQLAFFDTYDRFAWNVTGNGWGFPIDQVTAELTWPEDIPSAATIEQEAWTGYAGEIGADYESEVHDHKIIIRSTAPLKPHQGLTFRVKFSKGFFVNTRSVFMDFIADNLFWLLMVITVFSLFAFYLVAWHRVGRDPQPGVIMPLFYPPENMSPAAMRYVLDEKTDNKSFTAALINLAVKGHIHLKKQKDGYQITRQSGEPQLAPSKGEQVVLEKLLRSGQSFSIGKTYNSRVSTAMKGLYAKIKSEFKELCFKDNSMLAIVGLSISVLVMLAYLMHLSSGDKSGITYLFQVIVFVAVTFFIYKSRISGWVIALAVYFVVSDLNFSPSLLVLVGFLVVVNLIFIYLLKAPTPFGRQLMDKIEGFKLYLSTAEQNRLNIMHPPQMTPELFEAYLPYALALGVENKWSEQFATYLKQASLDPQDYQPTWYSGHSFDLSSGGSRSFGSLAGGMASTLSTASTPPSSTSSGGGGGFSGGGGGGGGGGGW